MVGHLRWGPTHQQQICQEHRIRISFGPLSLIMIVLLFVRLVPNSLGYAALNDWATIHDDRLYSVGREEYDRFAEHFLLPDDFDLAQRTLPRRPTPHELDSILNHNLFEGDILGMDSPPLGILNDDHRTIGVADDGIFARPCPTNQYYSSLNTQTYPDKLWREGKVPYMLEEGMSTTQRAAIASAFDEYKGKTCIRFVPRQSDDPDYIYVKRNYGLGCSSYVGRAGGNQTVSLEVDKCFSKGIIAHELMHALGFFHEHSRTDRDEYVDILEEHVRPGMLRNFEKYPRKIIDPLGMPYDYDSVMHYHKLAFSRNGRPTIVPKKRSAEIGQRYKLSEIDAKKVNKLYQCDDEEIDANLEMTTKTALIASSSSPITTITTTEVTTTTEGIRSTTSTEGEAETTTTDSESTTDGGELSTTTTDEEVETVTGTTEEVTTTEEETTTTTVKPTKVRTRGRSRKKTKKEGEEEWPEMAKKYITLSIWSMRGARKHKEVVPPPASNKSAKRSGLTRIRSKERGSGGDCVDLNAHCEMWERLGHCEHSAKYMRHYCRKSCGFCDEKGDGEEDNDRTKSCSDRNHFCTYWAQNGECDNGSKFMKLFCKRSCRLC